MHSGLRKEAVELICNVARGERMINKPTAFDHFLFLLSEMERVADRPDIRWPVRQTSAIKARLARILQNVGQTPVRDNPIKPN